MAPLLSVVAPLPNVQGAVVSQVQRLLELLVDLTPHFEVLLVSEGTCESTQDAARELCRDYPQLRLVEHLGPQGLPASVQTGLSAARGKLVFVLENLATVSPADLRRLWQLRSDETLVLARAETPRETAEPGFIRRLMQWGQKLRELAPAGDGIQLIRRDAVHELRQAGAPEKQLVVEYVQQLQLARLDAGHALPATRNSGFLQHLRDLALGE